MSTYHYPISDGTTQKYVIMVDDNEIVLDLESARYISEGLNRWITEQQPQVTVTQDKAE